MPAISTTRRSWISPHWPRVTGERKACTRFEVSDLSCLPVSRSWLTCCTKPWYAPSRATSSDWILRSNLPSASLIGATDAWASFRNSSELLRRACDESALKASESAFLASSSSFSFSSKPFLSASMVAARPCFSLVTSRIVRCCCAMLMLRASISRCRSGMPAASASKVARRLDSSRSCSAAASRCRLACAKCSCACSSWLSAFLARCCVRNQPATAPIARPRRRNAATSMADSIFLNRLPQRERGRGAQHLARGEPRVQREERQPRERADDEQRGARRQIELEHAPREHLADDGGADCREHAGQQSHGQEFHPLSSRDLRPRSAIGAHHRGLAPALVLGGDQRGLGHRQARAQR